MATKKFKVFGSEFTVSNFKEHNEMFDSNDDNAFDVCLDDTEHFCAVSKKTYTHDEEKLSFKYKYLIDASLCCDSPSVFYEIALVPLPESLADSKRAEVVEFCGRAEDEVDAQDVYDFGCGVTMSYEMIDDNEEINEEILTNIANTVTMIESLIGFYLDKPFNQIGSTGWDMLFDAVKGESFITRALDRWKSKQLIAEYILQTV